MDDATYKKKTLTKLEREFSKDEYVSMLLKENKELRVEVGQLKSEIDYLNHEPGNAEAINKEAKVFIQKEILYKNLRCEVKAAQRKLLEKQRECNLLKKNLEDDKNI